VADVAASNPGYLKWSVTDGIRVGRDKVTDALLELGYILTPRGESSPHIVEQDIVSTAEKSKSDAFMREISQTVRKHSTVLGIIF
jgi:hypothetical protein